MAAKSLSGGELYFIGEKDPLSRQDTSFVKIGIVRDSDARGTNHRVKEHQTGNPRLLHVLKVISTPVVERIETVLHAMFAPHRLSGEWFSFDEDTRKHAIGAAVALAKEAKRSAEVMTQAEALKKQRSEPASLVPSAQHRKLHSRIVSLRAQVSACKDLSSSITTMIETLNNVGVDCGRFLAVQEKKPSERFDEKSFKEKYEKLWEKYQVTSDSFSGSFRVVDPKAQRPDPYELNADLLAMAKRVEKLTSGLKEKVSHVEKLHDSYLELLSLQAPLDWELMVAEDHARDTIGSASEIEGLFVWKRELTQKVSLDKEALKRDEPTKYEEFVSFVTPKPSIIVAKDRGYFLK